jgi:hypothetical protein
MSFDARSRERLEALGRTLPQRLPAPEPKAAAQQPSNARHPVETERNPEQLFRELMSASRDGTVPPHLMDRLRELEQPERPPVPDGMVAATAASAPKAGKATTAAKAPRRNDNDASLYTEFQQLLLEDEG